MRALIFADRDSSVIAPLDREYPVPLLPVAGKELILYTVEDLVGSGITNAVFVIADHADRLERLLGDGSRWGASFRFVLSRGSEQPSAIWRRVKLGQDEPVLVLRGDLLRSHSVANFLQQAQESPGTQLCGLAADPRGSIVLLRPGHSDPGAVLDLLSVPAPAPPPVEQCFHLVDNQTRLLDSLSAYHRACLDVVAGAIETMSAAGGQLALGLNVGLRASVSPRSLKQGRAYVGDRSRVHPEAEMLGNVMISSDVVVDRAAIVHNSVILPHTYIGEMLEVSNAVVSGDTLMRVDTGAVLRLSDAFLLGRLSGGEHGEPTRTSIVDRFLALVLLILSAPLWPLAVIASLLESAPLHPDTNGLMTREVLVGNRHRAAAAGTAGGFGAWRFNTRIPVLAFLPRLLAVIGGDLRLFGVSPLTPSESESRGEDWQLVRDRAPVGLIGPTQLALPVDAPLDERLMSDAFFVGQRDRLGLVRLALGAFRTLFSSAAWSRRQT
jgi:mannose-1-phosphate guanylyltransferase/phosphomannomutase